MKLWLLTQDKNNGYDTYDSAVVVASDEEAARNVPVGSTENYGTWAKPEYVKAQYIGEAAPDLRGDEDKMPWRADVICASFNAG